MIIKHQNCFNRKPIQIQIFIQVPDQNSTFSLQIFRTMNKIRLGILRIWWILESEVERYQSHLQCSKSPGSNKQILKQHPDQLTPIPVQDEWLVEWENTFSINLFPKHSYIKLYQRNKEMHFYGVWKITRPDRGTWHKIVWMWNSLPVQYLQVSACGRTVVCYQCWHWSESDQKYSRAEPTNIHTPNIIRLYRVFKSSNRQGPSKCSVFIGKFYCLY